MIQAAAPEAPALSISPESVVQIRNAVTHRVLQHYPWLEPDEAFSAANLSAVRACQMFDPDRARNPDPLPWLVWKATWLAVDQLRQDKVLSRKPTCPIHTRVLPLSVVLARDEMAHNEELGSFEDPAFGEVDNRDSVDRGLSELAKMHPDLAEVITESFLMGQTYQQIAAARRVSESSICFSVNKGLAWLRRWATRTHQPLP